MGKKVIDFVYSSAKKHFEKKMAILQQSAKDHGWKKLLEKPSAKKRVGMFIDERIGQAERMHSSRNAAEGKTPVVKKQNANLVAKIAEIRKNYGIEASKNSLRPRPRGRG